MLTRIGSATEVTAGQTRVFDISGTRVNVANIQGHLCAIDDTCFDIASGAIIRGPAPRPVRSRQVKVEGDDLFTET